MAKWTVRLRREQEAELTVEAPADATPQQLQDAALGELDAPNAVPEWHTTAAWPAGWSCRDEDGAERFGGFLS